MALPYLVWRTTSLGSGWFLALSVPLLAVEMWSVAHLAALAHLVRHRADEGGRPTGDPWFSIDVVVTARGRTIDEVERTLIACTALRGERGIRVIDGRERHLIAALAAAYGATYEFADVLPIDDPRVLFPRDGADTVLWLDAGQVPMPDVDDATTWLHDPRVAVVQLAVGLLNEDSLAHVDRGRDTHALMRSALAPALSTRGLSPWFGPGSIVRRAPLADIRADSRVDRPVEQAAIRLHAAGYRTAFEPTVLVRGTAPDSLEHYLGERRLEAERHLAVLRSIDSPLTGKEIPLRVRAAHLALLSRFGGGLRLLLLHVLTVVVVLTGIVPFTTPVVTTAAAWLGVAGAATWARRSIGGGTMASGDWIRNAWRTLGVDLAAFAAVASGRADTAAGPRSGVSGGWGVVDRMRLLTALVVLLEVAVAVRAATLVWPTMLPAFTAEERLVVLAFGIALVVPMLDVLQLLVNRKQRRRQFRIEAGLPISLDGRPGTTVDLAAGGAGVVTDEPPATGALVVVELRIPRLQGDDSLVRTRAEVRNVVPVEGGRHRVGLLFSDLSSEARRALIAFCAVEYPHLVGAAGRDAGPVVAPVIEPGDLDVAVGRRRSLRVFSALAASLGLTTAIAGPAVAEVGTPTVCVTAPDGGPVVGAPVSFLSERGWVVLGETGPSGCLTATALTGAGEVELSVDVDGLTEQQTRDLSRSSVVTFRSGVLTVRVLGAADEPVAGASVRAYGDEWLESGDTADDGSAQLPVLFGRTEIEVAIGDQRFVVPVAVDGDETLVVRLVRLVADGGVGIAEIDTGSGWRPFVAGMEILPGRVAVRLADGRVEKLEIERGPVVSLPSGNVTPINEAAGDEGSVDETDAPTPAAPDDEPTLGPTPAAGADGDGAGTASDGSGDVGVDAEGPVPDDTDEGPDGSGGATGGGDPGPVGIDASDSSGSASGGDPTATPDDAADREPATEPAPTTGAGS